jgi:type II secretory pathway component PulC
MRPIVRGVRLLSLGVFSLILAACGGSPPPVAVAPAPRPAAKVAAPAPRDTLTRQDVVATIDAGFGRFLGLVEVEPSLEHGKFVGWTIVSLRPAEFWGDVDLKPGDVVTAVNGKPIERDTQAFEAFQSLRVADAVNVSYRRGREQRSLSYRIVETAPVASR